jgi:hypothetical protein
MLEEKIESVSGCARLPVKIKSALLLFFTGPTASTG